MADFAIKTGAKPKLAIGRPWYDSADNKLKILTVISPETWAEVGPGLATSAFAGLTKISVSTTEPSSPQVGDLWVDTN